MDTRHLRMAREARGLSQEQLADALGITQQMYSGYEQGKHDPKSFLVREICEVLGVSGSYLLGVSDADNQFTEELGACRVSLMPDELQLVLDFRACSPEMKRVVVATAKTAASSSSTGEPEKRDDAEENTA